MIRFNDRVENNLCRDPFVRLRNAFDFDSCDVSIDAELEGSHSEGESGRGKVCVRAVTYLLPQSSQSLLLGMSVDVGANHKRNDVEKRYPCMLRQELLRKCQC